MPPSEPTTPVRVPKAVSTYTPSTQDPDLRSQINTVLLRDGHISKIQEALLHSLNANPSNWPTLIHNHALALLRTGKIVTFPQLMEKVLEDVKMDSAGGVKGKGRGENGVSLALPKEVIGEGVKVTRECLELVCEVQE